MGDIFSMAAEFRTALLKARKNREFSDDGLIERFPGGNCGIVCDLLGRYLIEQAGVRSWYTSGKIGFESHVWLTLENGDIVDITGDQYKNQSGSLYYNLPVYVGKMDAFHSQFRLNGDPTEITPKDWTPDCFGEDWMQRKKRIAYEIILKYIG